MALLGGWTEGAMLLELGEPILVLPIDSPDIELPYPIYDNIDPSTTTNGGIDLSDPSNVESTIEYDPETGQYIFSKQVGNLPYRRSSAMSLDEYLEYNMNQSVKDYWREKFEAESFNQSSAAFAPSLKVGGEAFDRIFGGNTIDIRPQGSAELTFGVNVSKTDNPRIPERQRRISTFDFNQRIQLNVVGNIGEKLKLTTSYNTEATFDFENQMKLEYTGYEDEIIKKIEAGNVSLPLRGSLITGSQSLFGIKTELQFGRLTATTVFSQQKGQRSEINVAGGAQTSTFELKADNYEANRHYFLSNHFREAYNDAMATLPNINSGIDIQRIEVWIVNTRNDFDDTRNIIAFSDLGEDAQWVGDQSLIDFPGTLPSNSQNNLYGQVTANDQIRGFVDAANALNNLGYQSSVDYEKVESARLLAPSEFSYNARLGFISLNQSLNNDEVLAVAYEYTFQGQTYKVGEFSTDGITAPNGLIVKLLKATVPNVFTPLWDLMMKNVYSIGAFQVNSSNFILDVLYNNPSSGVDIPYIPREPIDGVPLIQALNVDRLDPNGAPNPDGVFDFVNGAYTNGGTINAQNGRVFFPVVEPFGDHLREIFEAAGVDENIIQTIVFEPLYDSTKTAAQQLPQLNRFKLKGTYQSSSSSEISLNALNIPQGSVTVTAGGVQLVENQDYTVDYNLGRVKIINDGLLESQTPIKISLESNSLFSIQTKTLMGSRFDYRLHDDFTVGGTILNLTERPLTQKVNIGDEPISNTIWGLDADYQTTSNYLTKLVDQIPLIDTKEESTLSVSGEFAHLVPGHSKAIGKTGTSYIDDFEGSQSSIDMKSFTRWNLASTPQGQPDLFPEAQTVNELSSGYNRAKMAWYVIDPLFFGEDNSLLPPNVTDSMKSDHRMRQVLQEDLFPQRQLPAGAARNIATFDLAYYPSERGPYNYDAQGQPGISAGLNPDGSLADPGTRWAGITRDNNTTDFEASNVEFIQFWLMDPFNEDVDPNGTHSGGDLYFNLGSISEDVLRDDRKAFENGLPKNADDIASETDTTNWGRVPTTQFIVNAFDQSTNSNSAQDVGLDGFNDGDENSFFTQFLSDAAAVVDAAALATIQADPSADNYHYYRGTDYDNQDIDILGRYKEYNGLEGNSPTDQDDNEDYSTQATQLPNNEDINNSNNLDVTESYYQYRVSLRPQDMVVGSNYITDIVTEDVDVPAGGNRQVRWYQFRIPIREPDAVINNIQDFRSIRFMRIFLKEFNQPTVLRFARLDLIRGEWRKYLEDLDEPADGIQGDPEETLFNVAAVNIEENSNRTPINYVLPPGITQEIDASTANLRNLNEQSMVLEACNLLDGDARAAYKNVGMDIRMYKKLKMFVHMEAEDEADPVNYGDVSVFIRLGADYDDNYYEYEIPLEPTVHGEANPSRIWPEQNNVEIVFTDLQDAKTKRNQANFPLNRQFVLDKGTARITVKGNPNLSNLVTVMIGVRNPLKTNNPWKSGDDGFAKCFEVWVNELRLTDFNERGGWAAIARMNAKLADFGSVAVAANISKPGFGSIEKRVSERQQETIKGVDASSNLELSKFLPEKTGIKIPMYVGYSETVSNPQFDPLSPDLEFDEVVKGLTKEEKRERLKKSQTFVKRRSINFTNVRKERGKNASKPKVYDIENWAATYSFNETFKRDINTEYNVRRVYNGALTYAFNSKPILVRPLYKVKFFRKSKYLKWAKEFNFYLGPRQLGFATNVNRDYQESLIRSNTEVFTLPPNPQYTKTFTWNRVYDFKYDLTKSLKMTFGANNAAIIGEPPGRVDREFEDEYQQYKDSVLSSIKDFGETTNYNHALAVDYNLPLDKFPMTDWINSNARYTATYDWTRAPLLQDSLGHIIQNSRDISINGQLNMVSFYNKLGYFKKINDKYRKGARPNSKSKKSEKESPRDKEKQDAASDSTDTKASGKKWNELFVVEQTARLMMMVKNASFTYSVTEGTLLPGFDRRTNILGMDPGFNAPGFGFVFGQQDDDFAEMAASRDWLVRTPSLFNSHVRTRAESRSFRVNIEPIQYLRIELTGNRDETMDFSEFFRWGYDSLLMDSAYVNHSPQNSGSISMSIISWRTAFSRDGTNDVSQVFINLLESRREISQRLSAENDFSSSETNGYGVGYGPASQDVLIPAFIAAYTGRSARSIKLSPFKMTESPNWRISYDGLSKLELFKKFFKSFRVNHTYRSSFNTSYITNLNYQEGVPKFDIAGNFIPELQVSTVTISESFRPLFGIDMSWNNSFTSKVEIIKDRTLAFSLTNLQLTESSGNEVVVGLGYRLQEVRLPFKKSSGGAMESDVNLRADLSIRNNRTITRRESEDLENKSLDQTTAGQQVISIKTVADYVLNERLNVSFFFERVINNPAISTSFPTANTNAGLRLRFTLTQ